MDSHPPSQLLAELLAQEGISHPGVLAAVASVPRHLFVTEALKDWAYENDALPIGFGQTISQPFVVAAMTERILQNKPHLGKVLEIGTGSGYQAAILAKLADTVYTIERVKPLLEQAEKRFKQLHYTNIVTLYGDGYLGWPEHSPYEAIIVTAAAADVPGALKEQLAEGGRLIIPVDSFYGAQQLQLITRREDEFITEILDPVIFVRLKPGKTEG
jgi:protein-L-isoaspartate(D-aspartate) O-methyltransferase